MRAWNPNYGILKHHLCCIGFNRKVWAILQANIICKDIGFRELDFEADVVNEMLGYLSCLSHGSHINALFQIAPFHPFWILGQKAIVTDIRVVWLSTSVGFKPPQFL